MIRQLLTSRGVAWLLLLAIACGDDIPHHRGIDSIRRIALCHDTLVLSSCTHNETRFRHKHGHQSAAAPCSGRHWQGQARVKGSVEVQNSGGFGAGWVGCQAALNLTKMPPAQGELSPPIPRMIAPCFFIGVYDLLGRGPSCSVVSEPAAAH